MRLHTVLTLSLLLPALHAQGSAKDLYDQAVAAQKELRPSANDPAARDEFGKKIEAFQRSVKDTIAANKDTLANGESLYWRARLEMLANESEAAAASLKAFLVTKPDTGLGHEARVLAAQIAYGDDHSDEAKALLADVKADQLTEPTKKALASLQSQIKTDDARNGLNGKEPPAIVPVKVLNGAADWSFASLKGKVVVVDFWATWCPPCRAIIPDLVKLQEKHGKDGLHVVGVTRFYGNGMDFDENSKLPHGGKSVGSRDPAKKLSEADEVKVNENFIKAFHLNYPVVFSDPTVGKDAYGVTGIPTVFVVGRDGKVIGHVVGGGEKAHEQLVGMIEKALGGAADAAGKKAGD